MLDIVLVHREKSLIKRRCITPSFTGDEFANPGFIWEPDFAFLQGRVNQIPLV